MSNNHASALPHIHADPTGRWVAEPHTSRLLTLPNEILCMICAEFCLHCQLPRIIDLPFDVLEASWAGQKDLARLSRVCKRLQPFAQPVLFHYYYRGNYSPREPTKSEGTAERRFERWLQTGIMWVQNDRLPSFLRSVVERPDLAICVKALGIIAAAVAEWSGTVFDQPPSTPITTSQLILDPAQEAGLREMRLTGNFPFDICHPFWLQELAVALLPSIRQLMINRPTRRGEGGFWHLERSPQLLSNLTYLAVLPTKSAYEECSFADMMPPLNNAPKLEEIVAVDQRLCHAFRQALVSDISTNTHLWRLKRLKVNRMKLRYLRQFLTLCPLLEDVEFADIGNEYFVSSEPNTSHRDCFEPVKQTLRRLCFIIVDESAFGQADDPSSHSFVPFELASDNVWDTNFGDYPTLEILEMNQSLLCGILSVADEWMDSDTPDLTHLFVGDDGEPTDPQARLVELHDPSEVLGRLPASLRILHVRFVVEWGIMKKDLDALARGASTMFPKLQKVRIEVHPDLVSSEDIADIQKRFGEAGIEYEHGLVPIVDGFDPPLSMLGQVPGCPSTWMPPMAEFRL